MGAYRHSMAAVQRSAQRSATGAAAYRAGQRLVDVRTGAEYDYSRRRGVAAAHLIVPGAHVDAVDRQALWAAVERQHKRGDAVVAREVVVSLPHQLDPIDRTQLVLQYARELSDRYGVAVDVAVHLPSIKPGHDERNHHAHLLMSACSVKADAGDLTCGKKVEALDPIAARRRGGEPVCEVERSRWAELVRQALATAGVAGVHIDHRSYQRQGIEQIPQIHLGPANHDNLLRHQAASNVIPLDRTRRYLEIAAGNTHLAEAQRYDAIAVQLQPAEVIQLPTPEPRADEPVVGPSAEIVPMIRPTKQREPQPIAEPERRPAVPVAYSPPAPAQVSLDELEARLAEAERLLAAAEVQRRQREQERQRALQREQAAQRALEAAQGGLWARLRAVVGFAPPRAVQEAQQTAQAASAAAVALLQGQRQAVGLAPTKAGFFARMDAASMASEVAVAESVGRGQLVTQIDQLRGQIADLRAEDAEKRRQEVAAVAEVVALVVRLDAAVAIGDPGRHTWRTLSAVDKYHLIDRSGSAPDPYVRLAALLTQQPYVRQSIVAEIASRLPELETIEQSRVLLVPSPDLGRDKVMDQQGGGQASVADSPPQGLLAVIEAGPAQAWPQHWGAYLVGCEQRGQITAAERELVADWLAQQPVRLSRDALAEYVRGQDDQADQVGPQM